MMARICHQVARRARAWIETYPQVRRVVNVARRARAWIETVPRFTLTAFVVARRARAWIETTRGDPPNGRRPPRATWIET